MTQLDIPTAAARLADLVAAAAAGEEVVIADAAGRPVARLVAANPDGSLAGRPPGWTAEQFAAARARGYGTYAGQVWMSEDCFDPLTDEELKDWGI
jgi:antitoxin (DNA-binding transcriptional repressor) of toxin-antitoxin stability system